MTLEDEPTLYSTCSPGIGERCGYTPHRIRDRLDAMTLPCRSEPAYEAASAAHPDYPDLRPVRFLVCTYHAPEVRLMKWLASLRTYVPLEQ